MPEVTIVIPTYDRPRLVRRTLLSLSEQRGAPPFEVVLVDDGSGACMTGIVESVSPSFPCRVLWQRRSGGRPAAARNLGIHAAAGELVILLDDDMVVPDGFVRQHYEAHSADDLVLLGQRASVPHIIWSNAPPWDIAFLKHYAWPDPRAGILLGEAWYRAPWAFFASCNVSTRREHLFAAGLFDEAFTGWGFEDTDMAYRLHHGRLRFCALEGEVPLHLEAPSPRGCVEAASPLLHLNKIPQYLENGERFAAKWPGDPAVQALVYHHRLDQFLSLSHVCYDSRAPHRVRRSATEVAAAMFDAVTHTTDAIPPEVSLLTPYREEDEAYVARSTSWS